MTIIENTSIDYEAIVVGGSFAGLSAAMQLARARRHILILDTGLPRNRFATASHGFLGQDGRTPADIIATARQQVLAYPTVDFVPMAATQATQDNTGFMVSFGEQSAHAKRLVLATGVTDLLPDLPGIQELWGDSVGQCPYCHGYEVRDGKIAILGLGEFSLHQAMMLRDWSEDVTLLTNATLNLNDEQRARLQARGVKIETAQPTRLIGHDRHLNSIEFEDGRREPYTALFIAARYSFSSPLAEQLGCEVEATPFGPMLKTSPFKETSVPGVFAGGDNTQARHSITNASAEGAAAGASAHQSLIFGAKLYQDKK